MMNNNIWNVSQYCAMIIGKYIRFNKTYLHLHWTLIVLVEIYLILGFFIYISVTFLVLFLCMVYKICDNKPYFYLYIKIGCVFIV